MEKVAKILLIEDNEGDIVLTIQALKDAHLNNELTVIKNGEEAILYLQQLKEEMYDKIPDLIFLDLNLPKVSGQEVLVQIKNDDVLKLIPVLVLTTSESDKDIMDAYRHYANCYITKPTDFQKFIDAMNMVKMFWFDIVQLPNRKKYENRN